MLSAARVEHLLAIERAGPGADGGVYTMRARDVSALCGDLHELFLTAATCPGVRTTGRVSYLIFTFLCVIDDVLSYVMLCYVMLSYLILSCVYL